MTKLQIGTHATVNQGRAWRIAFLWMLHSITGLHASQHEQEAGIPYAQILASQQFRPTGFSPVEYFLRKYL